jgi:hypothetical protein
MSPHAPALLRFWGDRAALYRAFWYRTCRTCRLGFWQQRRRHGGPQLYCTDGCRLAGRRKTRTAAMRRSRTESGLPHHRYADVVDGRLVFPRGPGGNQRRGK